MINEGQIHASLISKEIQLNIILSNTLPLSPGSLSRVSFKKFENEFVNLDLLSPYIYEIEIGVNFCYVP